MDHEEWEKSPQFHEKVMERQEHQQEREQAFLSQNRNCFAIYQVSRNDPQNVRFMNLDWLESHDVSVDRSNYDLIYTAPLSESIYKLPFNLCTKIIIICQYQILKHEKINTGNK